jgi:predicted dehydrogenase
VTGSRRVAIVGYGAIASAHAAAIDGLPNLELVAVVDNDAAAVARAVSDLGVPGFATVAEMIDAGQVDAACVCTPPATHKQLTESLLTAGLDVLCEKPLATSTTDALAMIDHAARAGRTLAVSDKFRRVADLAEAGVKLRAGEIGIPLHYAVTFCAPVDVRGRWPSDPNLSGGGVLMDNGPHAFDVLSHVLDAPIARLSAVFATPVLAPPVEDSATVLLQTEKGSTGRIELSWVYFSKDLDYLVVQGTEGTIRVGWTGGQLRRHGEREWTAFGTGYGKGAAFRGVWEAFLQGDSAAGLSTQRASALEWIETAYQSARTMNSSPIA